MPGDELQQLKVIHNRLHRCYSHMLFHPQLQLYRHMVDDEQDFAGQGRFFHLTYLHIIIYNTHVTNGPLLQHMADNSIEFDVHPLFMFHSIQAH